MKKTCINIFIILLVVFSACKKQTANYSTFPISAYSPLQVGKYISYNLDSLIFINFGTKDTTIHYQVKYSVDATITDNLGRPGFRIQRYIRTDSTVAWTPDNTFMAFNTGNTFEFIENNLRFLKLVEPIKNGYSWSGNSYIDTYSNNAGLQYMDGWNYTYANVNANDTLTTGILLDSTLTVNQCNLVLNDTSNLQIYSEVDYSVEQYTKGIGMVYKKFLHREYQPPTPGTNGYALGYGITLTMFDHN